MARGKYAQRAADKRAELEVTTDLASYQHRVARLTAENRELREQMDRQRRGSAAVERSLRAERDEGVAPQVEAMRLALQAERTKSAERLRAVAKFIGGMIESHEWTPARSEWNQLASLLNNVPELITPRGTDANRTARRTTPKAMRHIAELHASGRLDGKSGPRGRVGEKITD